MRRYAYFIDSSIIFDITGYLTTINNEYLYNVTLCSWYLCTFPGTWAFVTSVVDNEWLNIYPVEGSLRGFPA